MPAYLAEANQTCHSYQGLSLDEKGKIPWSSNSLSHILALLFFFLKALLTGLWLFRNKHIHWVISSSLIGLKLPDQVVQYQKGLYTTVKLCPDGTITTLYDPEDLMILDIHQNDAGESLGSEQ